MVQENLEIMSSSIHAENTFDTSDAHQCRSNEVLTDLRIEYATMSEQIVHMSACFQELSASLDEHMKRVDENMKDIRMIMTKHESDIIDIKYNCRVPEQWESVYSDVSMLKKEHYKRIGAQKWDDRIYEIIKYGLCVIIGALIVWFMQGGKIT